MALTPEQNKYLIEIYAPSNGNVAKALKLFDDKYGFTPANSTVIKKWNEEGLTSPEKGRYSNKDFEDIFRKCGGNLEKIAEETGLTIETLSSRARVLGLKPLTTRKKSGPHPTDGKYEKFLSPNI